MEKKKKGWELNAFVIILAIMLLCAILTWIIPAGSFERVYDELTGRELVIPGTFQSMEGDPVGPIQFITSIFTGFVDAADIMFFIIFASCYVFLLTKIGALNAMTGAMLRVLGNRDHLIIPAFMIFFALGGTTFGMYEETYALIPAFIVIALTLGYDRIVGGAIVFVGVATGFAAATLNPFTIGVAAKVSGIPLVAPAITIFRCVCFVLFVGLAIAYTMNYAKKIKMDPTKSILYGQPQPEVLGTISREECRSIPFTRRQKVSMLGFLLLIAILVWGIIVKGWWFTEIASLFLTFYVGTALINKLSPNDIAETFVESTRATIYGVLLVGFARGISIVLAAGGIVDSIVYGASLVLESLPVAFTGIGMLVVQNILNFFIPSGSGLAIVTMPIMAPLADVVGLSREMANIAYQFGDGFSNMIWPTVVAVECAIMGVTLGQWYKFIMKLFAMMFALQCIMMVVGVAIGI